MSLFSNAQVLGYEDIGVLLSSENKQTTARTMAMKNAFGALGGDLSALSINPAGAAIFSHSVASISMGNNHIDLSSEFYGTSTQNSFNSFNLNQVGGLLLFKNDVDDSKLRKVAVGINLNTVNNFSNNWTTSGKAEPTWIYNPLDEEIEYTIVENQKYSNITSGSHTNLNFTIAAQYGNSFYLGASLNTYNVEFVEDSTREEISRDDNENTVNAFESFWQELNGEGFSMGIGILSKVTQNLRLGLSYNSPVWYDLNEYSNLFAEDESDYIGYYNVIYSNDEEPYYNSIAKEQAYNYKMRTPSKTTASLAYVFGRKGLISTDFIIKDYKGIHLRPNSEFAIENNDFKEFFATTYRLNMGAEWRVKKLSLRGGYSYETSPYLDAIETDNIQGFSFGFGYDFGNYVLDFVYDNNKKTEYYNFYPDFSYINGAELSRSNEKIAATLVYKF